MAMRIIHPSDVYRKETIVGTIFGPPGLRKTTLGFTADRPLLLDFDGGVHRASFRKAFVPVDTWDDVLHMEKGDFEGFATVVIDTAGRALDLLALKIMSRDPKMSNKSGGLSLAGFGALKTEFATWLRKLKSFGLNVLLILHSEEKQDGDNTTIRIDAQGASKQEIYKSSDFMGLVSIDHEGAITLTLSPSDTAFGKNPANLPAQKFAKIDPSSTHIARVFSLTLDRINAMTEEQREVSATLEAWRDQVMKASTAEELTALIAQVPTDERVMVNAKRVLNSIAIDKGFWYDKEKSAYVPKPPENVVAMPENVVAMQPPALEQKRQKLVKMFAEKYPDAADLLKAFKKADAACFFKGKLKDARQSPDDLSDMDVAIMSHAIESGQVSI